MLSLFWMRVEQHSLRKCTVRPLKRIRCLLLLSHLSGYDSCRDRRMFLAAAGATTGHHMHCTLRNRVALLWGQGMCSYILKTHHVPYHVEVSCLPIPLTVCTFQATQTTWCELLHCNGTPENCQLCRYRASLFCMSLCHYRASALCFPSVFQYVCPFVRPSVRRSVCLYVCVCLSVWLSPCLSLQPPQGICAG